MQISPSHIDILAIIEEFLSEIAYNTCAYNTSQEASENLVIQFFSQITTSSPSSWIQRCDDGAWCYNLEKIHSLRDDLVTRIQEGEGGVDYH